MVLAPPQEELISHVAVALIGHETTTLHPDWTNAAQVRGDIRAVAHAVIAAPLEVLILVEDDLLMELKIQLILNK